MSLTVPYPTLGTGTAVSANIDSNINAITTKFGNIDNSDVAANAGLDINKLSASYEYMVVPFVLDATSATSEHLVPLYNDSKGNWTAVEVQWAIADTGDPSATFLITWGKYNGAAAPGAFTVATTILSATTLVGANIASQGVVAVTNAAVAFSGSEVRSLRASIGTNDADAGTRLYISLLLKRQIAT